MNGIVELLAMTFNLPRGLIFIVRWHDTDKTPYKLSTKENSSGSVGSYRFKQYFKQFKEL